MNIYRLVTIVILFFSSTAIVSANIRITEIQYDVPGTDTDKEWIEIYNDGETMVDLTGWKFFDGSNHNLVTPPQNGGQGSMSLAAREIAIISADASVFVSQYENYVGTVIDTVMTLSNSGETLKLLNKEGEVVFEESYTNNGAQGDGNSLHKVGEEWTALPPTPGIVSSSNYPLENSQSIAPSAPVLVRKQIEVFIEPLLMPLFAHNSYVFKGGVVGVDGLPIYGGYFVWTFGDGSKKDFTRPESVEYNYKYPGTYVVSFSYFYSSYYPTPVASKQFIVTVVDPEVKITNIFPDGSIEIKNEGPNDIDISEWVLKVQEKTFIFPKLTIVLSGKGIVVPASVTTFSGGINQSMVSLLTANKEPVIAPTIKNNIMYQSFSTPSVSEDETFSTDIELFPDTESVERGDLEKTQSTQTASQKWNILFFILVSSVIGGIIIYEKKQKRTTLSLVVDEFEITELKEKK